MTLLFNMNKYAKISNFQNLPIAEVESLWKMYLEFVEKNDNKDFDIPDIELDFK